MHPTRLFAAATVTIAALLSPDRAAALQADPPHTVLFSNVRIFNGVDAELLPGHVLVEGNSIARISETPIPPPPDATVIDGKNRILSPGFIDIHAHLTIQMPKDQMLVHPWVTGALAGDAARGYLFSGFTTVRDAGGAYLAIDAIVEGVSLVRALREEFTSVVRNNGGDVGTLIAMMRGALDETG